MMIVPVDSNSEHSYDTPDSRYSKGSWNSELNTWREVSSRSIDDDNDNNFGDTTIATSVVIDGNNDDGDEDDDDGYDNDDGDTGIDEEMDIHIDRMLVPTSSSLSPRISHQPIPINHHHDITPSSPIISHRSSFSMHSNPLQILSSSSSSCFHSPTTTTTKIILNRNSNIHCANKENIHTTPNQSIDDDYYHYNRSSHERINKQPNMLYQRHHHHHHTYANSPLQISVDNSDVDHILWTPSVLIHQPIIHHSSAIQWLVSTATEVTVDDHCVHAFLSTSTYLHVIITVRVCSSIYSPRWHHHNICITYALSSLSSLLFSIGYCMLV
jgi:hypothetical protein